MLLPVFVFQRGSIRDLPGFAKATGQSIPFRYDRASIWGLEFEAVFGDVVARADCGIQRDSDNFLTETLERVEKPVFEYLLGFDYMSGDSLYLNLQFGQTIVQDWDSRIVLWPKKRRAFFLEPYRENSATGEIKPEFRFYIDLQGDACIFNPRLMVDVWRNVVVDFGAEFYGGRKMDNGRQFQGQRQCLYGCRF